MQCELGYSCYVPHCMNVYNVHICIITVKRKLCDYSKDTYLNCD